MKKTKTALISVFHKEGIVEFAQQLVSMGWNILASGGTARHLKENDIPVKDVAEIVGGKAILGHRVVTLSREVHAGILARLDVAADVEELEGLGVPMINLVCCDFYPLRMEIEKSESTRTTIIEMIDIGGPTMVKSAGKAGRIVICDPNDREQVIEQLKSADDLPTETYDYLQGKAFAEVTRYYMDAARYLSNGDYDGMLARRVHELAYGENRDQSPAFIFTTDDGDPLALSNFKIVNGNPGWVNAADIDTTVGIMCRMAETFRQNFGSVPYIAIACKHAVPSGAAFDWNDPVIAAQKAMMGDPVAVMGAEVVVNFPITDEVSKAIHVVPKSLRRRAGRKIWGVDVIAGPEFSEDAISRLTKRKDRRLLINPALSDPFMPTNEWMVRPVRGGFMQQRAPRFIISLDNIQSWTNGAITDRDQLATMFMIHALVWGVPSNCVGLANNNMLIGLGLKQRDRRTCCYLVRNGAKASGHDTEGAVFASDAFFYIPKRKNMNQLREGPELLRDIGCVAGVVPADGKYLDSVVDFFTESGMNVAFLPKEHRGFSQH